MDYIIATHNMKKRDEMQRILAPLGIRVLLAEEAGVELTDAEETGTTFEENAFIKAESGCRESGMPCIADDSGLAVDYLDGAPGVYSARYAGEHGNDEANNALLLKRLENEENRRAHYTCAIVLAYPDGTTVEAEAYFHGEITRSPRGERGFGYDPMFVPLGSSRTVAEYTDEEKNAISHRAKALEALVLKL